ncbi:MAG: DUF3298 and DUF4163 domain-containing protein [Bacteroidetes bacterium]|nr:DUF3298 and DUF4163 domain-containing protein [Bacteroidota bacterium]
MKILNAILLFSLLFLACGRKPADTQKKDTTASLNKSESVKKVAGESGSEVPDSLKYEMKKFYKTYKGCKEEDDNCAYIKMEYPVFTSGAAAKGINNFILSYLADSVYVFEEGRGNKTLEKLADVFFKDFETMKKENPDWPGGYALDLNSSVEFNKNNIITLNFSFYLNSGGAHPNSYFIYYVLDASTGKIFKTKDLFVKGFEPKLNKLIEKKYRAFREMSDKDRLDGDKGMLFENHIEYNENVGLLRDGVEFYYNNYEIAAYAVGPSELKFTYKELDDLLKPEFKNK